MAEETEFGFSTGILDGTAIDRLADSYAGEKVAIVDLDAVVFDTFGNFERALAAIFGESVPGFSFPKEANVAFNMVISLQSKYPEFARLFTPESVSGIFADPEVYANAPVIPETVMMINVLSNAGYKIVYATSRPEAAMEVTARSLQDNSLPADELLLEVADGKKKADLIQALATKVAQGSVFYDDRSTTIKTVQRIFEELQQAGQQVNIEVFGPPTTWNGGIEPENCKDTDMITTTGILLSPKEVLERLGLMEREP